MGKIKTRKLYRDYTIEVPSDGQIESFINAEERTVTLSFSSEECVKRDFGIEILDHNRESVDLSRLIEAGPLLINHDTNDVVGIIEDCFISESRKGCAVVRFGKSERAKEIFQDVIDGIRRTVSVGYIIERIKKEGKDTEGNQIYRATKWKPYEISLVTIPADTTVGVGRNADNEEYEVDIETETRDINIKGEIMEKEYLDGIKAENKRQADIRAIAANFRNVYPEVDALVNAFIDSSDRTVEDFVRTLGDKINAKEQVAIKDAQSRSDLGLSQKDIQNYSILRMAEAMATGNWSNAGFELECSREFQKMTGSDTPRGQYIPFGVLNRATTTSSQASKLIQTEYWGNEFVDALRNASVCASLGCQVYAGLVGDVTIPVLGTAATYTWITETNTASTQSQLGIGSISLTPTPLAGNVGITRKMMKQAGNPTVEAVVRKDFNDGIATALDTTALANASGGTGPSGILYTNGVPIIASGACTWGKIVGLESSVSTNNAAMGSMAYVTNAKVVGTMKQTPMTTGGTIGFIMSPDGTVNGYKCAMTNAMPATIDSTNSSIIFGNFNDLIIGLWGGVDVVLDTVTLADSGGLVLRTFVDADVKLRRAVSFARMLGVTTL